MLVFRLKTKGAGSQARLWVKALQPKVPVIPSSLVPVPPPPSIDITRVFLRAGLVLPVLLATMEVVR